jgi:hypothetical protein
MKPTLLVAALSLAVLVRAAGMETYEPDKPSGTKTGYIVSKDGKKLRITITNFGIEDARPAREFGRHLAHAGYNSGQAEAEIWRAAWEHYPNDRFFARCFAQQAERAYTAAIKKDR